MDRSKKFPVPKFAFEVKFPEATIPFQEVTGLDQEYEFLEYRSGSDADLTTQKRSGLYKSGQVSFKKGIFKGDKEVWTIFDGLISGKNKNYRAETEPIDITVTLKDETGKDVITWTIVGAVPTKLTNGDLKSDENAISIEQIDFVYSRINSKHL
jgi:phage tail-like protein